MNSTKINQILNEIILDKFILNFLPGLILYYSLTSFITFSTGNGLISMIIVVSVSWFLGLLEEFLFFKRIFLKRREQFEFNLKLSLGSLFGEVGLSILITIVYSICHFLYIDLSENTSKYKESQSALIAYIVVFGLLSSYLIFYFYKFTRKNY